MELKQENLRFLGANADGSNRTFMELKHLLMSSIPIDERVLIVPLWN